MVSSFVTIACVDWISVSPHHQLRLICNWAYSNIILYMPKNYNNIVRVYERTRVRVYNLIVLTSVLIMYLLYETFIESRYSKTIHESRKKCI